ncbi:MAG: flagellar hook-length control protein FliK [Pseudomonadota bacterium]
MSDITKIAASIATPSLSTALQQNGQLTPGQAVEAKITQILNDELIRLTSSLGTFEVKASHPSLQPGVNVQVTVSNSGAVSLSVLSQKETAQPQTSPPLTDKPAVIANLSTGQTQPQPNLPKVYSATGQTVSQLVPSPSQANAGAISSQANTPLQNITPPVSSTVVAQTAQSVTALIAPEISKALASQSSLAPLVANLEKIDKLSKNLPEPVRAAADEILKVLSPFSKSTSPQTLQQAIKDSGTFFENKIVKFAALPQVTLDSLLPLKMDLKGALLNLENVLRKIMPDLPARQIGSPLENDHLPPPVNGETQSQQARSASLNVGSSMVDIITTLAQQTDSALSRLRVLQFASMPASLDASPDQNTKPAQILHVDLPLLIGGQAAVIPLQIERDAERKNAEAHERRWRVRFAFDLSELGPVHAMLALGGGLVNVTLWAERPDTYQLFQNMAKELHGALLEDELEVADIEFRSGSPTQPKIPTGSTVNTQT